MLKLSIWNEGLDRGLIHNSHSRTLLWKRYEISWRYRVKFGGLLIESLWNANLTYFMRFDHSQRAIVYRTVTFRAFKRVLEGILLLFVALLCLLAMAVNTFPALDAGYDIV